MGDGGLEGDSAPLESRRRDLYAVSLGLILFQLAGAQIKPEASTFFGAFDLALPGVIVYGAWLLLAYFLWRFLQKGWPFDAFRADIAAEALMDMAFQQAAAEPLKKLLHIAKDQAKDFNSYSRTRKEHQIADAGTLRRVVEELEGVIAGKLYAQPVKGTWIRRVDAAHLAGSGMARNDKPPWRYHFMSERVVALPFRDWVGILLRSSVRATIRREAFADQVLPLMCAMAAVVVGVIRIFAGS